MESSSEGSWSESDSPSSSEECASRTDQSEQSWSDNDNPPYGKEHLKQINSNALALADPGDILHDKCNSPIQSGASEDKLCNLPDPSPNVDVKLPALDTAFKRRKSFTSGSFTSIPDIPAAIQQHHHSGEQLVDIHSSNAEPLSQSANHQEIDVAVQAAAFATDGDTAPRPCSTPPSTGQEAQAATAGNANNGQSSPVRFERFSLRLEEDGDDEPWGRRNGERFSQDDISRLLFVIGSFFPPLLLVNIYLFRGRPGQVRYVALSKIALICQGVLGLLMLGFWLAESEGNRNAGVNSQ